MTKQSLLIIGCTSKIAQDFIHSVTDQYDVIGTYNTMPADTQCLKAAYQLDLEDNDQIITFVDKIKGTHFAGVLFFASTYTKDPDDNLDFVHAFQRDIQVNALSILLICRSVSLERGATIFLFGDAGLDMPKAGFSAYSISKAVLSNITKVLAVEQGGRVKVICFKLGPTKAPHDNHDKQAYYDRNLAEVNDPATGLVKYVQFLLSEKNLNMTGVEIAYDGGTYIKR